MKTPSIEAKRHHYIPEMVLINFTDQDEQIWFNRQEFPPGVAKHTNISNVFVQGQLYTYTKSDGSKDRSLESFFSDQETTGASFIKQLSEVVRRNEIPRLDQGAWEFWHQFQYFQLKRTPGYFDAIAKETGFKETVRTEVESFLTQAGHADDRETQNELSERIYRNSAVYAQGQLPGMEMSSLFKELGIIIYRIANPRLSFIVGDVPGASARISGQNTESGKALFLPIAHDLAMGHTMIPKTVLVKTVGQMDVRRMNEATAARSSMIAGRSERLISSLSRSVVHVGVVPDGRASGTKP